MPGPVILLELRAPGGELAHLVDNFKAVWGGKPLQMAGLLAARVSILHP